MENKSFKIAFVSDIHIDFYVPATSMGHKLERKMSLYIEKQLRLPDADILVFAGDNTHYPQQMHYLLVVIAGLKKYKKIFVTFGNHDLYLVSNGQRSDYKMSWKKVEHLKALCESVDTVEFLDGKIVDVDGIKIGGTGMWYDFTYGKNNFGLDDNAMKKLWMEFSNDPHNIASDDYENTIRDKNEFHYHSSGYGRKRFSVTLNPLKFFEKERAKLVEIVDKCDVFVSHVSPAVPPNLNPEHDNASAGFYFFDGSQYLQSEKAPKLWIFGHVHDRYNYKVNNTRLVCNPLGYDDENFHHSVITIDLNDLDNFSFK